VESKAGLLDKKEEEAEDRRRKEGPGTTTGIASGRQLSPACPDIDEQDEQVREREDGEEKEDEGKEKGKEEGKGKGGVKSEEDFDGIEKEIAQLNKFTSDLENLCTKVGTEYDNRKLRSDIQEAKESGEAVFKTCFKHLKQAQKAQGASSPPSAEQRSRVMWFRSELDRFKRICLRVPMEEEDDDHQHHDNPITGVFKRPQGEGGRGGDGVNPSSPAATSAASAAASSSRGVSRSPPPRAGGVRMDSVTLSIDMSRMGVDKMTNIDELKRTMDLAAAKSDYKTAARCQERIQQIQDNEKERKRAEAELEALENLKFEEYDLERKAFRTPKLARLVGVLFGLVAMAYSIYSLATYNSTDPGDAVRYLFFFFFGVLILLAEFRLGYLLEWFSLLKTASGLGSFYLFVGFNAVGRGGIFGWFVFAMAAFTSIFYFVMACSCRKLYYDEDDAELQAQLDGEIPWKTKATNNRNNTNNPNNQQPRRPPGGEGVKLTST